MGVFHVFKILQRVPNRVTHHKCARSSEIKISKRTKKKISISKAKKAKVPNFQEKIIILANENSWNV